MDHRAFENSLKILKNEHVYYFSKMQNVCVIIINMQTSTQHVQTACKHFCKIHKKCFNAKRLSK